MGKVYFFIILLISCLLLISCGPVDYLGKKILLENTESSIVPEKETYLLSDEIKLYYSFDLDPEKFNEHEYHVSVHILKNGKEELCNSKVLVFDENGYNITGKYLICPIIDNTEITKEFTLKPQEPGNYIILVGGYAYTRKKVKGKVSYECDHIHYLNVQ